MRKKEGKILNCRVCNDEVHNCGSEATAVTCWRCVSASLRVTITDDEIRTIKEDEDE
jgi:hypothetical protein